MSKQDVSFEYSPTAPQSASGAISFSRQHEAFTWCSATWLASLSKQNNFICISALRMYMEVS